MLAKHGGPRPWSTSQPPAFRLSYTIVENGVPLVAGQVYQHISIATLAYLFAGLAAQVYRHISTATH